MSKLRAFLSLVVDEKKEDEEHNLGIRTLPNLEFQFICANALIGVDFNIEKETFEYNILEGIKEMMTNIAEMFYGASSIEEKEKVKIKFEGFREFVKNASFLDKEVRNKILSWSPFDNKSAEFFSPLVQFGIDRDFDIVIGNPPYIQIQGMAKGLKEMYQNAGYESFKSTGDIYQLFYEKCLSLLSGDGVASLITSNKWMRAGYGASTREYFYKNADVLRIIDLGAGRFESATVDVNIIFYSKTKEKNIRGERSFDGVTYSGSLKELSSAEFDAVVSDAGREWVIMSGLERSIFEKISRHKALKDWDITINRGIVTGDNKGLVLNEEEAREFIKFDEGRKFIKRYIFGENIKKYFHNTNLYLIAIPKNTNKKEINKDFINLLKVRDKEFNNSISSRKEIGTEWYELRGCSFYNRFLDDFILWTDIISIPSFSINLHNELYVDTSGYFLYTNNKTISLKYLLGILNSKLSFYQLKYIAQSLGNSGMRIKKMFVEKICIPLPDKKSESKIIELVNKIIEVKKQGGDSAALEGEVDRIVYSLYGLSEDEVKVVEG